MPKRAGFTLAETMIIVVLVGLLVAMVAPPMYSYLQSHKLQAGTDRMVADIQYARSQAIARGSTMRIITTANSYQIINVTDGSVLRSQNLDQGVTLAVPQQADFFPWGMAETSVFNISNTKGAKQVSLLPTGIVEVHCP